MLSDILVNLSALIFFVLPFTPFKNSKLKRCVSRIINCSNGKRNRVRKKRKLRSRRREGNIEEQENCQSSQVTVTRLQHEILEGSNPSKKYRMC